MQHKCSYLLYKSSQIMKTFFESTPVIHQKQTYTQPRHRVNVLTSPKVHGGRSQEESINTHMHQHNRLPANWTGKQLFLSMFNLAEDV